ncbi:unnamed protein product [Schistocephalus solidus]|uniref:Uncharacterized protein n=1 Tax=Schistocephalus solidus TaxID=70667 RepID=A0A183SY40_SCHSO|nr:unnamed protein product [Schistocephalus solidus]
MREGKFGRWFGDISCLSGLLTCGITLLLPRGFYNQTLTFAVARGITGNWRVVLGTIDLSNDVEVKEEYPNEDPCLSWLQASRNFLDPSPTVEMQTRGPPSWPPRFPSVNDNSANEQKLPTSQKMNLVSDTCSLPMGSTRCKSDSTEPFSTPEPSSPELVPPGGKVRRVESESRDNTPSGQPHHSEGINTLERYPNLIAG